MTRSVEYCLANVDADERRRLQSRAGVREANCLERCGRCRAGPFLVVDGTVREGSTHARLLEGDGKP